MAELSDVKKGENKTLVLYALSVVHCFVWLRFFNLNCKDYAGISSFPGRT